MFAGFPQLSSPDVSYAHIAHISADELNELARLSAPGGASVFDAFNYPNRKLSFTDTSRGVNLYRVFYVFDTDARSGPQTVSGLLAIPDEPGATAATPQRELPLVMYNHGTLFNRDEVPSQVVYQGDYGGWQVGSGETFLDLLRLTNDGYALIASDYVGLGINRTQEGYSVKEVSNDAMLGMIEASRSILADLNINPGQLYLNGWSQGALNTQWITQKLETLAVPVAATAVAAPFNNWLGAFKWANTLDMLKQDSESGEPGVNPYAPAPWLPLTMGQAIASYEYWYGLNGLFDAIIKDKVIPDRQFDASGNIIDDPSTYTYADNPTRLTYRQVVSAFTKDYNSIRFDDFSNVRWQVGIPRQQTLSDCHPNPYDWTTVPGFSGKEMLIDGVFNADQSNLISDFLRQLEINTPQVWQYTTPLRAWYGTADEALPAFLVNPDMAVFGGSNVSLVPVDKASHRETFLNSLYASAENPGGSDQNLIDWFDSFRKADVAPPVLQLADNSLKVVSDDFGLLPILLQATQQQGERPLHVQILRIRQDGSSELIGSLGGTTAVHGQHQSLGSERVLLQVGETLGFQLLSRDGGGIDSSTTEIRQKDGGAGFEVIVRDGHGSQPASLRFGIVADPQNFSPSPLDRIAAPQGGAYDGLLQLRAGQVLNLELSTDSAFINTLGFVRLNLDPITGLPLNNVGAEAIDINSDAFRDQIDSLLDPGFRHSQGGRNISSELQWSISQDGLYAPVLITQEGKVFCGAPGSTDQQMRLLGANRFGFEDLKGLVSDYDWNDSVLKVVGVS